LDAICPVLYDTLDRSLKDLCSSVKLNQKILLSKSPGKYPGPDITDFEALAPGTFMPFEQEDMINLRKMYESRADMKAFPNPFENQP